MSKKTIDQLALIANTVPGRTSICRMAQAILRFEANNQSGEQRTQKQCEKFLAREVWWNSRPTRSPFHYERIVNSLPDVANVA